MRPRRLRGSQDQVPDAKSALNHSRKVVDFGYRAPPAITGPPPIGRPPHPSTASCSCGVSDWTTSVKLCPAIFVSSEISKFIATTPVYQLIAAYGVVLRQFETLLRIAGSNSRPSRHGIKAFAKKGAVVVGISPDKPAAQAKFKQKYDLPFTLLADEEKAAAEAFGVWKEKNMYGRKAMGIERSTFVIGPDGKIEKVYSKVKAQGHAAQVLGNL